jgi:DNA polymerase III alpha subunit
MARIRTGFSFHTAIGHLEEVMERLVTIGAKAAPITDRSSTFGFVKWEKIAKKNKLKPIFGVELAVVSALGEKKPAIDYWTFLAKSDVKALNELIGIATRQSSREPMITYAQAMDAKGLIKIAGETVRLELVSPSPDFFIGLSPSLSKSMFKMAKD